MHFSHRGCDQIHYIVCEFVAHVYEWVFTVKCVHACVCPFLHACMYLKVTDQKGGENPETNKLDPLCAATLYDVLHNRKWEIPRMAPELFMNHERPTHQTGRREWRECHVTHRTEESLVPVNLSGWPDTSARAGRLCGVALPKLPPKALLFSLTPLLLTEYFHIPWLWKHC